MYPHFSKSEITVTLLLKYSGLEYRHDLLVYSKMEKDLTIFCKICKIILIEDQNILVTKDFETLGFVEHLHAYHAREHHIFGLLRVEDLPFFQTI